MTTRFVPKFQILSLIMLACLLLTGVGTAQESDIVPGSERPMFTRLPATLHQPRNTIEAASTPLKTWNGSFTYQGTTYSYNMVGTQPSANTSTTVQVEIIPIKIVISGHRGVTTTYDPAHVLSNGKTVTANTVASPIFASIPFTSGGTSMGTTQYIDAYQRANFWGTADTGSHLLLGGPTVLAEQTLSPPTRSGKTGTVFGFTAGLVDINWFDSSCIPSSRT
jgi:hypothetical protein